MKSLPSTDRLRELFAYDDATGVFIRKIDAGPRGKAGSVAGHRKNNGYLHFSVDGKKFAAHRIAWKYVTCRDPVGDIDHIDGNRSNNAFSNLRDVSRSVNLENRKGPGSHNKATGILGAYRSGNRYTSRIQVRGADIYLGCFATAQEAHDAYMNAKRSLHEGNTL